MRIGIIGAGRIANTMAITLQSVKGAECYAVAARDINRARDFADKYGFEKAYGSYLDMLSDPYVELVYIATPHSFHYEHIKLCLDHGKHVICEKPFTANAVQAQEVLAIAEERGLFITEAIWTRYMPMRDTINQIVRSGIIGKATSLSANLGYPLEHKKRMTKPELAGGALLDLGVYAINFASMVFGDEISGIFGECIKYETGVDAQETIMFSYADGKMASLYVTTMAQTDRRGIINGSNGYIEIENINNYESIRVYNLERRVIAEYAAPLQITGYEYEISASIRAILDNRLECIEMPHYEIIRMMQLMDSIRDAWGIKFPFEKKGMESEGEEDPYDNDSDKASSKQGKKTKGSVRMITEQTIKGGVSRNIADEKKKDIKTGNDISDDEIQKMIRSIPTPPIDKRGESKRSKAGKGKDSKEVVQYLSKKVEDIKSRPQGMRAGSLDEMREKLNDSSPESSKEEDQSGSFLGEIVLDKEKEIKGRRIEFIDAGVEDELFAMKRGESLGFAEDEGEKKTKRAPVTYVVNEDRIKEAEGKAYRDKAEKGDKEALKREEETEEKKIETIVDDSLMEERESIEQKKGSAIGRFFKSVFKSEDRGNENLDHEIMDEDDYGEDD
ncbi:MAG: Gfo/Idh/MocA family oxidoreductase [Lachnospiraceae bacterium]|nr:Gfo/Idh/MocA family oxidoreductase [Lachnospiraceae bacterium]